MTDDITEVPEILDALRGGPVGVPSSQASERARSDLLPWLEAEVEALPARLREYQAAQRRRRIQVGLISSAAVSALAAAIAFVFWPSDKPSQAPEASAVQAEGYATLVAGRVHSDMLDVLVGSRLGLSSRLTTGEAEGAVLRDSTGYEVSLSPVSDFSFLPADADDGATDTRVRLSRGEASFSVPPLPSGSTLTVLTNDAPVRVIGTKFSVSLTGGAGTCVRVTEGKVSVETAKGKTLLLPGQSTGCIDTKLSETDVFEQPSASVPARVKPTPRTTLAEQNALLTRALSHESQGNTAAAQKAFRELLQRYPSSPLAPEARTGLARVTEKAGDQQPALGGH